MVLFSSRSQVVNFFTKWKHHYLSENIAKFQSNDNLFTQYLFLNKKNGVIWWLLHDNLRGREQEWEEKGSTNSAPKPCFKIVTVWKVYKKNQLFLPYNEFDILEWRSMTHFFLRFQSFFFLNLRKCDQIVILSKDSMIACH